MAENVKTVNGLAIASVKTFDGLAEASCKTIMGVDNTSGGGGSWTYSIAVAGTDTNDTSNNVVPIFQEITLTAGTVSEISVYSANCGSGNIKVALYDGSKNLLGNGTVASPNDSAAHDLEVSITPVVIGSGTFYVAFEADTTNQTWRYLNGSGTALYDVLAYSDFPENPFTEAGPLTRTYRVGALIA